MPPEVTEPVTAAPPAPLFVPNEADPPGTHAPLEPVSREGERRAGQVLAADILDPASPLGQRAAEVAANPGLPPTAQEAAPGRLWRSTDPNGLELAAKDPIQARRDYQELVGSYQTVMANLVRQRVITNANSGAVWNAWAVCEWHATQTAVTTNDANVWHSWNTVGTTATSCGCTTIIDAATMWGAWNATLATQATQGVRQTLHRARPTIEATPEQHARWEEERKVREAAERQRQAEFAEAEKKRAAEQAEADRRAKKLLVECLSPEQRDTLEKHNYFDVRVPSGTVYRIHKGWSHNVKRVKPDGTVERGTFCAHPSDQVPHYDNMLAQKFTLETDEAAFLRIANRG